MYSFSVYIVIANATIWKTTRFDPWKNAGLGELWVGYDYKSNLKPLFYFQIEAIKVYTKYEFLKGFQKF